MIAALVLFLGAFCISESAPTDTQALLYLSQYGYLKTHKPGNSSALFDGSSLRKAVEDFQSFAGLDVTGKLDSNTIKTMSLPRCGVKDVVGTGDTRFKRYTLQGSRWKVRKLSYAVSKYPPRLSRSSVDEEVKNAFDVWAKVTNLEFQQASPVDHVHIDIRFEKGEHGDGDPFDGPGGTLAHAYFPVFGGDAHFDAEERWTIGVDYGTNLFQVAAHEFGHSLGLSHSDVREALMAPFYRGYIEGFELHEDDIEGIQALYGEKKNSAPPKKPDDNDYDYEESSNSGRRHPAPDGSFKLCNNSKIDTIFNSPQGYTYIFKGDDYWKLTDDSVAPGYPKKISKGWPGLPGHIDAAFTYNKNGKTYFFKGSKYWRYKDRKVDGSYPKEISEGFTGIPDDLDAAMVWSGNGKIYFFKGSKFWRFDPNQNPPVRPLYPKLISIWENVPNNLDAAFQWTNGYTYFFKDGAYYRFNDRLFAVDNVNPAFPRSTAYWWFGCKNAPRGTIGSSESNRFNGWLVDEKSEQDIGDQDSMDTGEHHAHPRDEKADNSDLGKNNGCQNSSFTIPVIALTLATILTANIFK